MESVDQVKITVSGFTVNSGSLDQSDLDQAARDIASDIGMTLASIGTSSGHGSVLISYGGMEGSNAEG